MAEISIRVCDVCGNREKPAKHYRVEEDGRVADLDLCEDHATAIEEHLPRSRRNVGTSRKRGIDVRTIEEIEAMKRPADDESAPPEAIRK